jgi:TonB family protein
MFLLPRFTLSRAATVQLRHLALVLAISSLALFAPAPELRAQQVPPGSSACRRPGDPMPDGRTPAAVADSLFALARRRGDGPLEFERFTRPPRVLPDRRGGGHMDIDDASWERMSHGGMRATLASLIDPEGRPVRVEILRSSGDAQFDMVALGTLRDERYRPAQAGSCPVAYFLLGTFEFRAERQLRMGPH